MIASYRTAYINTEFWQNGKVKLRAVVCPVDDRMRSLYSSAAACTVNVSHLEGVSASRSSPQVGGEVAWLHEHEEDFGQAVGEGEEDFVKDDRAP